MKRYVLVALVVLAVMILSSCAMFQPECSLPSCEYVADKRWTCPCCNAVLCNTHWNEAWDYLESYREYDTGYNDGYSAALEKYGIEE